LPVRVWVNGEARQFDAGTVADVVATLTTASRGVAVAVDGTVVPRSEWDRTTLRDGAVVEVLVATQGG
jgi:sulfur carrier protein